MFILLLLLLARTLRKAQGVASLGLLWFLLVLVPSSALVVLDRAEPMSEHRTYLAGMGLFLAMATGADWLVQRFRRRSRAMQWALRGAIAWAFMLFGIQTLERNRIWDDPVALWTEASAKAPGHWLPYVPLGEALHAAGRHAEAADALSTAARLNPAEASIPGKLGFCLIEVGQLDRATSVFLQLAERQPGSSEASYGLGLVALADGRPHDARTYFADVLANDPANIHAHLALAAVEAAAGDSVAALRFCEETRRIAPGFPGYDDCVRRARRELSPVVR